MKISVSIIVILLLQPVLFGQNRCREREFKNLKQVSCENFESSQKKKGRCELIDDVINDENYDNEFSKQCTSKINTPTEAYIELRSLYKDVNKKDISCWTEYKGYYLFAIYCEGLRKRECLFYCFFYIKKGGNEFRYYAPRF